MMQNSELLTPAAEQNSSTKLIVEQAQSRGEIPATDVILRINKRPAGIIEVLTRKGGQTNPNQFYRYLIDAYTGVNLNGPCKRASEFKQGLDGPTKNGKVEFIGENPPAAALRLIDAGFGQGYMLTIHKPGYYIKDNPELVEGDPYNSRRSVNETYDLRTMTESEVAELVLELSTQI